MLKEFPKRRALAAQAAPASTTADALAHLQRFCVRKLPVASPLLQPKRHTRTIHRTRLTGTRLPVSQPFRLVLQGFVTACILIFASGCQPVQQVESTPAPEIDLPTATATATVVAPAAPLTIDAPTPADTVGAANAPVTPPAPRAPTDDAQATIEALAPRLPAPIHLAIADAAMDVAVEAMGWEVVGTGGATPARWLLPENAAGWHVNSAYPGEAGNMIISGRQLGVDAVFAPLALGAVQVGQQIVITDDTGGAHTYTIREVSQPLPLVGADATTEAAVADYMAASSEPILTLITGWPNFTTTHRIFVVAALDQ